MTKARDLARLSPNTSGKLPTTNLGTGALLKSQVFNVTPATTISITNNTYYDFVDITYSPASSSSNIVIFQNIQLRSEKTGTDARFSMRMLINNSVVWTLQETGIYDYSAGGVWYSVNWPQLYAHSNTTGDNVGIKIQAHCDGRASSLSMYGADGTQGRSHVHVMEIAV